MSLSHHPAGIVISPIDIHERYGTIIDSDGLVIMNLDMEAGHRVGVVKYDILGLDTVSIIDKTCKLANIKYPHTWEIDFDDKDVWSDIVRSPVGLFQFVNDFAFNSLKRYHVSSVEDVCAVTAAIRPSGASYRDRLLNHEFNSNPSKQIDDLLKDTSGFLVYQEQIIAFLQHICGMSGGEADSVRRAIGHKDEAAISAALPKILNGYCERSDKPRDVAEAEAHTFLKVIEDASAYSFGYNHALAYSILTYYCAYYRYHFPLEFITALLNSANTEDKIKNGIELAASKGIKIMPIKFRHSLSEYTFDRETNSIYKGMESIKYLNKRVGRELYKLKNNYYSNFIELLDDVVRKKIADARQLDILIKLDFFSEFGNPDELLEQVTIYDTFRGAKQLNKSEMDALIPHDIMLGLCEKETEKKYVNVNDLGIIKYIVSNLPPVKTKISKRIEYEQECLGYVQLTIPDLEDDYCMVMSVSGKYASKMIELYSLKDGSKSKIKVRGATLNRDPLYEGEIIRIIEKEESKRWSKNANGDWITIDDTELILTKYAHLKRKNGGDADD